MPLVFLGIAGADPGPNLFIFMQFSENMETSG